MLDRLRSRGKDGPVKAPALNITLISGGTIALGTILTRFSGLFEEVFGFKPADNPGPAAGVFAALVIAIGLIVAADLIARGVASSRPSDTAQVPEGWTAAIIQPGRDDTGYSVAAARVTSAGLEFFITKDGASPSWRTVGDKDGDIVLTGPSR